MGQDGVCAPFTLLLDQPEDTQRSEGSGTHLRALQLSDLLVDEPHCEWSNSRPSPTHPHMLAGWCHRSWKRSLRQDFGASPCYELPPSRALSSVPGSGPLSSGDG